MSELDPRKQAILNAVVIEYVRAAEPVGSEMLVHRYPLGVKSATVRNELAEMSDLGYLEQPHTSAGRIPSDSGYRYYVDRLIVHKEPEPDSKQKVQIIARDGDALQTMLRDTARVLSRISQLLSVAATVKRSSVGVRTAMVTALGPQQALLVLVLTNGQIENRMLECPPGLTLEDIGVVNDDLKSSVAGKALRTLARAKHQTTKSGPVASLLQSVFGSIRTMAGDLTRGLVITEGEEFMLAQPEFLRDAVALKGLLETVSNSDLISDALGQASDRETKVTIGRENKLETMHQVSLIRRSFYVGEDEAGFIAVLGPTRMSYEKSIPMVDFTANAISESLTKFLR